jgi:hypothetical protein
LIWKIGKKKKKKELANEQQIGNMAVINRMAKES